MDPCKVIGKDSQLLCGIVIVAITVLVRISVGLGGYSGAGKPPLYGDYEAQRHWMEITINVPVNKWYYNDSSNDLQYWGLDYPPLTAYHSWLCGIIAHHLNPDWVVLNVSRGHESYQHKLYMRYTVIVADVVIYFSAVLLFVITCTSEWMESERLGLSLLLLLQPSLIIIDHGHFQYNCISLGLALFGVVAVMHNWDVIGSIAFSMALNYKQMELYHALPFFFYLLGKSFQSAHRIRTIIKLGVTVIAVFVLCWSPYVFKVDDIVQVLHRLFPFSRGLYEDKVANIWCTASVMVKLRQWMTLQSLMLLASVSTLIAALPSCVHLLFNPTPYCFLLALVNCSMSFFLFSFQVHEKSILLAVMPASLLSFSHPLTITWFSLIALFSMYPLLVKDGLVLQCWALAGIFYLTSTYTLPRMKQPMLTVLLCASSVVGLLILCAASHVVRPPIHLPDLFPVLISGYSCILFLLFWLHLTITQLYCEQRGQVTKHIVHKHLKAN